VIKGFKEFILRGNVIDLAVAVVIGAAFTAVVNSIVASIINPLIEIFWKPAEDGTVGIPVQGFYGEVVFPVGDLLNAVIAFFAVALVVYFVFVHPMNLMKQRAAAKAGIDKEPQESQLPTEQEILVQIRDLLQQQQSGTTPKP